MATLKQFTRFYVEHGIKNIGQLITLRKNELSDFALPMNSTLHYAVRDIESLGLPEDDELFVNAGQRILTDYRYEYPDFKNAYGQPIRKQRIIMKEVKIFLRENKRFKWINHSRAWYAMPSVPYVINYNALDKTYKYRPRDGVLYWRAMNFYNTVIDGVCAEVAQSDRNQFIYLDIPDILPTISRLMEAEKELVKAAPDAPLPLSRRMRNIFDTDGKLFLLEMWVWSGDNSNKSIFSKIPEDKLDKVNILTSLEGRYNVLNLGTFWRWIRSETNPKGSMTHPRAQRVILRHFMALQQLGTVGDDETLVDTQSLVDKTELATQMGIKVDEGELIDAIKDDKEYIDELPAAPTLDVNIDTDDYTKGKTITVTAKAKNNDVEEIAGDPNDAEEYLFKQIDLDLAQHSATGAQIEADTLADSESVYRPYTAKERDLTTSINESADEMAAKGLLSSAEVRRIKGLAVRYKNIDSPFEPSQKLDEYKNIDPESLKVPEVTRLTDKKVVGVVDDSMMNYSMKDYKDRYINDVLGKDIVNSVLHFQNAEIAITDMKLDRVDEFLGSYNVLSVQLTPVNGKPSTTKIKLPVFEEDGHFIANGVEYFMKTQRNEAPIRKVDADNVALTSYISKIFVKRTSRVRFNYGAWLVAQINKRAMENDSPFTDIVYADVFDKSVKLPLPYTAISKSIRRFKYHNVELFFDARDIGVNFDEKTQAGSKSIGGVPFGKDDAGNVYVMTPEGNVIKFNITDRSTAKPMGAITEFLGIDRTTEPANFGEMAILGFDIPVGILLAWRIGLGNLLKTSGCQYRRAKRGSYDISPNEFSVVFEDEVLIFRRDDQKACLIFNGFNRLKTTVRRMSVYSLDKQDAYATLIRALGIPANHTKQYKYIFNSWVDHITRDLLIEMEEPTDFLLLVLSAIDKLCDDAYVDPNAMEGSILRGHERIAGMIYTSMSNAVRRHISTPLSKQSQVSLNPNEVWFKITQDETVATTEESNPIHALKEQEIVVFRGQGGRGADTMTAKHRQFTKDSIGIISEANVDNGQTGTVLYLTANPNITSLRGTTKPVTDYDNVPKANVQSTAMMISAGSDMDDSKRVTFTSVMFTSTTFLHNATPNRVLTGGERTIQYRSSNKWARKAKGPGRVTAIKKDSMTITYDDGKTESFKIGRHYGVWSGTTIPHEIATSYTVGDVFGKDDIIAYNSHYFQPDVMNPGGVVFKRGIRGNMLQWEATDTLEDADTISVDFSKKLETSMTEKRYVKVASDHDVIKLKDIGDHVTAEDILCTLKPPMSEFGSHYNENALDALDALKTMTPKAEHPGVIEKIDVLYTGELDNMSETLQDIVSESDAKLYRTNKLLGIPVRSAQVPASYAIDGQDIGEDQVVFVYYITERVGAGIGDKLVAFNQLKTIISNIVQVPYVTESGIVIDVTFSRQSITNRIVNSPDLIGSTNNVVSGIEREMIDLWVGNNFKQKT